MKVDFEDPDLFSFDDCFASLLYLGKYKKKMIEGVKKAYEDNRRFCQEHLRPLAREMDLNCQRDPNAIPQKFLDLGVKQRRFSSFIPSMMGGTSSGALWSLNINMEEQNAVDPGFGQVLAGHGLGLVALVFCFNFRVLEMIARNIVDYELQGKPYIIDCAITEPGAGTDVEEEDLMPSARLMCQAKRNGNGGSVTLNGRKCFISSGHVANMHLILMPFDRKNPLKTFGAFIVPNGTEGFSLGKLEDKMGQKAGPASELIFEDCVIPQENVVLDCEDIHEEAATRLLHGVLGVTRVSVGSFGTGIARGAFEKALEFAKTHKWKGKTLIHHQWAQEMLTDMIKNVYMARSVYLEANHVLFASDSMPLRDHIPAFLDSAWFKVIFNSSIMKKMRYSKWFQKLNVNRMVKMPPEENQRIQFYSSMAKVVGSDIGVENCHKALELMGSVGMRHSAGAEKLFLDAKLTQIYEGTNQLNRLHMFKHFLARNVPGVDPFC